MNWSRLTLLAALLTAFLATPVVVFAQDSDSTADETSAEGADESDGDTKKDAKKDDDKKESADGSYEWKRSFGGGLEFGLWFSPLNRWETHLIQDRGLAGEIDSSPLYHLDLALEASVLEGTRFTLFGGLQRPFNGEPKIGSFYVGLEPAFAFRRDFWEVALGIGAGLGAASFELESGETMDAGLVVLRPFVEVRRYFGTIGAVYLRGGFNQWLVNNPRFEGIDFTGAETNLDEGSVYFALGTRFGSYPEHIKRVPDTDGDGLLDDVDECPEEPEDFDGWEDDDGCPDLDNDGDGIPDKDDKCPNVPEDMDGWQDEDGCPETDDDADGDGILNADDQCPNDPEDFDGFEDADGCPDPDNDGDGIPDSEDKCPNVPGVKVKQGCPFELVEVTLDRIMIKDKVFFDLNKATIKEQSFELLDQVAQTINAFPRIKLIEVQGHTDHAGKADYNKKLSDDRAKSVYDYLIGKGVDAARLQFKGYGMEQPLVPLPEDGKETKEAAAQNRRVEFVILEQEEIKKRVREDKIDEVKSVEDKKDAILKKTAPKTDAADKPAEGEDEDANSGDDSAE